MEDELGVALEYQLVLDVMQSALHLPISGQEGRVWGANISRSLDNCGIDLSKSALSLGEATMGLPFCRLG